MFAEAVTPRFDHAAPERRRPIPPAGASTPRVVLPDPSPRVIAEPVQPRRVQSAMFHVSSSNALMFAPVSSEFARAETTFRSISGTDTV